LDHQLDSKIEGDTTGRHPRDQARCSSHSAHAAGADDRVAAVLAGSLVKDEVAADREADLGAVAAAAGGVQVEGHGRVRRPARTRSASRLDAHRRGIRATMSTGSAGTRRRSSGAIGSAGRFRAGGGDRGAGPGRGVRAGHHRTDRVGRDPAGPLPDGRHPNTRRRHGGQPHARPQPRRLRGRAGGVGRAPPPRPAPPGPTQGVAPPGGGRLRRHGAGAGQSPGRRWPARSPPSSIPSTPSWGAASV
jgi:hypothetical protein